MGITCLKGFIYMYLLRADYDFAVFVFFMPYLLNTIYSKQHEVAALVLNLLLFVGDYSTKQHVPLNFIQLRALGLEKKFRLF